MSGCATLPRIPQDTRFKGKTLPTTASTAPTQERGCKRRQIPAANPRARRVAGHSNGFRVGSDATRNGSTTRSAKSLSPLPKSTGGLSSSNASRGFEIDVGSERGNGKACTRGRSTNSNSSSSTRRAALASGSYTLIRATRRKPVQTACMLVFVVKMTSPAKAVGSVPTPTLTRRGT